MATSGDRYLATSGDFFMATDNPPPHRRGGHLPSGRDPMPQLRFGGRDEVPGR